MKEIPILFSAPMVRALLDGSKTQTRRAVKLTDAAHVKEPGGHRRWHPADPEARLACPYGQPGDRLWVREAWSTLGMYDSRKPSDMDPDYVGTIRYMADGDKSGKLRPSMFMPRWASRITLEITGVRVERLQACNEFDARQEGSFSWAGEQETPVRDLPEARLVYRQLWESINGPGSWVANPWVWCIEFKRVMPCQQ